MGNVRYYFTAPVKLLSRFIFQSGSHFLFFKPYNTLDFLEKSVKIFYSLFYFTIVAMGIIECLILLIKNIRTFNIIFLVTCIPVYFIIIHPDVLRLAEERFIIPAYLFLLIAVVYILFYIFEFRKKQAEK